MTTERALNPKRGPQLFQLEAFTEAAPEPKPKRRRDPRPKCFLCDRDGLEQKRVAAPGGYWACGRGHGLIGHA